MGAQPPVAHPGSAGASEIPEQDGATRLEHGVLVRELAVVDTDVTLFGAANGELPALGKREGGHFAFADHSNRE